MDNQYDVMSVAASALSAERLRMDVISGNIANVHTTRDIKGEINPYRRKIVAFRTIMDEKNKMNGGVTADFIAHDESPMKRVFDPGHPDANQDGYVSYPNVYIEREMVDMAIAKAAYEANAASIQTYKTMFNAGLEI